jgi:hypothetical protein
VIQELRNILLTQKKKREKNLNSFAYRSGVASLYVGAEKRGEENVRIFWCFFLAK